MRTKLLTCAVAAALALAACGGDDDSSSTAATTAATSGDTTATTAASDAPVKTGDTSLGQLLTNADGLTLYAFTNDSDGTPTCVDTCADAWPALTVDSAELPAGLDASVFGVVERPDGGFQLAANDWPLYTFSGDEAPGDVNGQGTGGVWFVVKPDGQLNRGDAAAAATTAPPTTASSGSDY